MTTTIDQLQFAPEKNVVSYEPCYPKDKYEILHHTLSLYTQGNLEGKCHIEGSNFFL